MSSSTITPRTYYTVFAMLVLLTLLTVGISFLDLGVMHTVIALAIATCKGVLVALFFMHLWNSGKLTWLVLVTSLFWLGILFVLTLSDYLTRWWLTY